MRLLVVAGRRRRTNYEVYDYGRSRRRVLRLEQSHTDMTMVVKVKGLHLFSRGEISKREFDFPRRRRRRRRRQSSLSSAVVNPPSAEDERWW